jgi:uncharacterized membrane protein
MIKQNKALSIFLAVAIAIVLGCIGYITVTPQKNEEFTEFYILNAEGKAQNYPKQVTLGEPVEIVIGIVNHEHKPTSYRVEIKINGIKAGEVNTGILANEEKWERKISFTPQSVGEKQKVDFYLCKDSENAPYLKEPLRLSLDVVSP